MVGEDSPWTRATPPPYSGVPWALVDGYGLAAVKLGLERFLGGSRDARAQAG
jgi:hypothetical protein